MYLRAIFMRRISDSLSECVTTHRSEINLELAKSQWNRYLECVRQACNDEVEIVIVDSDSDFPDCCFIEDTMVNDSGVVLLNRMGHPSRRGEVSAIERVLMDKTRFPWLREIFTMESPACLDGGDVMNTGRHIFVGTSSRTNQAGILKLQQVFGQHKPVYSISMPKDGLHLKSVISHVNENTLVVPKGPLGEKLLNTLNSCISPNEEPYMPIWVDDVVSANVVSFVSSQVILAQGTDIESIRQWASNNGQWKVLHVDMSELIKADGALTCQSVLFYDK